MIRMLYLNNKRITLDLSKMTMVGSGKEGTVYRYSEDKCIKIFDHQRYDGNLLPINNDKFKLFTTIDTKHIILPEKLLYNEVGEIQAYIMNYIRSHFNLSEIRDKNILELINELRVLRSDIEILNQYNILINDLKPPHLLYNNGFYLIDSSLYTKYEYDHVLDYDVTKRNTYLVNELFINVLLGLKASPHDFSLTFKDIPYIYRYYNQNSIPFFADVLEKEAYDKKVKTLKQLRAFYYKKD
ncbi:MAG: hypothetical protein V8Q75_01000 [Bacilli bacterium]